MKGWKEGRRVNEDEGENGKMRENKGWENKRRVIGRKWKQEDVKR